ncbi:hypothetical protein NP233_g11260 [Leucocoprinus birnbaumii]|uniref:Cytochrome P450 n=1 Tax=Leucocoprinus birnbaumii TaxID=56174 RepID=A0AAD5YLF8_9AGAR|nr:hypothetical protein NP233_g11260 [Leucocoprinus birnbaumii]
MQPMMNPLPDSSVLLAYALAAIFVVRALQTYKRQRSDNPNGLPLPPGPKGLPLIGNFFDLPTYKLWLVYDSWIKKYGDMVYLRVFGLGFLILGSMERINDIFEKRGNIYLARPSLPMIMDLNAVIAASLTGGVVLKKSSSSKSMRWDFALVFTPPRKAHRQQWRTFHTHFNQSVAHMHQPTQIFITRNLLKRLLQSPDEYWSSVRLCLAAAILKVTYGIGFDNWNHEYARNLEEFLRVLFEASIPGKNLVDFVPLMKYIPSWVPGAGWKRQTEYCRDLLVKVKNDPYEQVKKELSEGKPVPSICMQFIEALPKAGTPERVEEETLAKNILTQASFVKLRAFFTRVTMTYNNSLTTKPIFVSYFIQLIAILVFARLITIAPASTPNAYLHSGVTA